MPGLTQREPGRALRLGRPRLDRTSRRTPTPSCALTGSSSSARRSPSIGERPSIAFGKGQTLWQGWCQRCIYRAKVEPSEPNPAYPPKPRPSPPSHCRRATTHCSPPPKYVSISSLKKTLFSECLADPASSPKATRSTSPNAATRLTLPIDVALGYPKPNHPSLTTITPQISEISFPGGSKGPFTTILRGSKPLIHRFVRYKSPPRNLQRPAKMESELNTCPPTPIRHFSTL